MSFVVGSVDAIGLAAAGRYTSHMSGTTSSLLHAIVTGQLTLIPAMVGVIGIFAAGAALSGALVAGAKLGGPHGPLSLLLSLEAIFLIAALLAGEYGRSDTALVGFSALAMGMQNATGSACLGHRTTHVTGLITDVGSAAGHLMLEMQKSLDASSASSSLLNSGTLQFGFVTGAVIGGLAFPEVGALSLVLPITALLAGACTRMRVPDS